MSTGIDTAGIAARSVDKVALAAAGYSFAVVRAGIGTAKDDLFDRTLAAPGDLPMGGYHCMSYRSGETQVHSLNPAALAPGLLPIWLDVERSFGGVPVSRKDVPVLEELRDVVVQATGRPPAIYCSVGSWAGLGNPSGFEQCPLVLCDYGSHSDARCALPSGWHDFLIRQYAGNHRIGGVSGLVDLDRWNQYEAARLCGWTDSEAVRAYQEAHGLVVDGVCGPRTFCAAFWDTAKAQ